MIPTYASCIQNYQWQSLKRRTDLKTKLPVEYFNSWNKFLILLLSVEDFKFVIFFFDRCIKSSPVPCPRYCSQATVAFQATVNRNKATVNRNKATVNRNKAAVNRNKTGSRIDGTRGPGAEERRYLLQIRFIWQHLIPHVKTIVNAFDFSIHQTAVDLGGTNFKA